MSRRASGARSDRPREGKDLLDIANAHQVPDARAYALDLARKLDASPDARSQIRELAEFRPDVADAIGTPPAAPPARRWWRLWTRGPCARGRQQLLPGIPFWAA